MGLKNSDLFKLMAEGEGLNEKEGIGAIRSIKPLQSQHRSSYRRPLESQIKR